MLFSNFQLESISASIKSIGDSIRSMKASKQPKETIEPLVSELVALKAKYESLAGVPFGGSTDNSTAKKGTSAIKSKKG